MKRKVFVLVTQLQIDKNPMPEAATYDEKVMKSWKDSFYPQYTVHTSLIEVQKMILRIKKYDVVNYKYSEVEVDTYAVPDKL